MIAFFRITTCNSNSVDEKPTINLNQTTASNSSMISPVRPTNRQIETRTSDGKRRITPMFIPLHHPTDPKYEEHCYDLR